MGTSGTDRGYGIAVDEEKRAVYTSGQTSGSLYGPHTAQYDAWVERRDLDTGVVLAATQFGTSNNERGDRINLMPGNDTIEVRGQGMATFEGIGGYYIAILNATTLELISGVNMLGAPGFQYTVTSNGVQYDCRTTTESLYATNAGGEDVYITKACASSSDYLINTTHCVPCPAGSNPNENQTMCITSAQPTGQPSGAPSSPSGEPSAHPSGQPTGCPSSQPSSPSGQPTGQPTGMPTYQPSSKPSATPTGEPSQPSGQPTGQPSGEPSCQPSSEPSSQPTSQCAPGYYHSRGYGVYGDACLMCVAGTYSSEPGMQNCTTTTPGHYSADGADAAIECAGGSFTSSYGSISCEECEAGTYANQRSGATDCLQCWGLWWSEKGSDSIDDCFQVHIDLPVEYEIAIIASIAVLILCVTIFFMPSVFLSYTSLVIACSFDVLSDYLYFFSTVFAHWSLWAVCLFFLLFPLFHAIRVLRLKIDKIQAEEEATLTCGGLKCCGMKTKSFPLRVLFPIVRKYLVFDWILFKWKDGVPMFNGIQCFPTKNVGGSLIFLILWYVVVVLCLVGQLIGWVLWPCCHIVWATLWIVCHLIYWGSLFFLVGFLQSTQIFSNRKVQKPIIWLLLSENISALLQAEIVPGEEIDLEDSNRALVVEICFETIPQLVLQNINSSLIGKLTTIAQFSRVCSIFILCNTIFRFAYWSLWQGVALKDIPTFADPKREAYSENPTKLRALSKNGVELISNVVSPLYTASVSHLSTLSSVLSMHQSEVSTDDKNEEGESLLLANYVEDILNDLHLQDQAAAERVRLSKHAYSLFLIFAVENSLISLNNEEVTSKCLALNTSFDKIKCIHEHLQSCKSKGIIP